MDKYKNKYYKYKNKYLLLKKTIEDYENNKIKIINDSKNIISNSENKNKYLLLNKTMDDNQKKINDINNIINNSKEINSNNQIYSTRIYKYINDVSFFRENRDYFL